MIRKIAIISLSSGMLGEDFISHELEIGLHRLNEYGVETVFTKHACKGMEYIKNHPEKRAQDLLDAFSDDTVDMILCAIGGDDTYRLLPYLFENSELQKVKNNKIFLGFSDSTVNHFMLNNVGLNTFYGQAFLPDICELDTQMLPYSKKYFDELCKTSKISQITPSDVWYEERTCFDESAKGTHRKSHKNSGFELLQGNHKFFGEILGGCIESMYDMLNNDRYADSVDLCDKYNIFPDVNEWQGKILLIESSEEKPCPTLYKKMVRTLKSKGIFDVISGILVGKPMDETYYDEYKKILTAEVNNPMLPILYNINVGHASPRCIMPFGVKAFVDADTQTISFEY